MDDTNTLKENVALQISEVEMLQSMYPNDEEFKIQDPSVFVDMADFVEGKIKEYNARLDVTINIQDDKAKYEIFCCLPSDYPMADPEIYVRSDKLNRQQQHILNSALTEFLGTRNTGDICIFSAIQWLQDNSSDFISDKSCDEPALQTFSKSTSEVFTRYWIYSHHIYNKLKRRTIVDLSVDLRITGFCLPGKPGIICAEGDVKSCEEFWNTIKNMSWKKITCKRKEEEHIKNFNIDELRRFQSFEEVSFDARKGQGREFRMDMGEFLKYLEQHDSGYVFKDLIWN